MARVALAAGVAKEGAAGALVLDAWGLCCDRTSRPIHRSPVLSHANA